MTTRRTAPHKPPDCSLKLSAADKLLVQADGRLAVVALVLIVGLLVFYGTGKIAIPWLGATTTVVDADSLGLLPGGL